MANEFVKAEKVVRTALAMLEREIVFPGMVWRDAGGDFKGAKDDTISIRLPAFVNARTRVLRGGRPITVDGLAETKVDVTLDTDVYKAISVTDEEMTLDIVNFSEQVSAPAVSSVARGVEDSVIDTAQSADFELSVDLDPDDPYLGFVDARTALNKARVPMNQRGLACGANVEAALLKSDRLSQFAQSGSDSALRDASIGRIAGFQAVSVPALDPDIAIAFHKTAFVLSMQAPVVPDGVNWGESTSFAGMAMRAIKDYDFLNVQDRFLVDVFIGSAVTLDRGTLDGDGIFTPSEEGEDDPILVRAVECRLDGTS